MALQILKKCSRFIRRSAVEAQFALQAPGQTTSYDQSGTYILSLEDTVDAILLDQTTLLAVLGFGSGDANPVTQTKHEWDEDELNPYTTTASRILEGDASATGSALVISGATTGRITAGTLLRDQLSGKTEVVQVTAVSGVSATVTRGYGNSSQEGHASGAVWDIIANPRPQGMEGPKDESVVRERKYNYTQIFSKGVRLTGTAIAIQHNGIAKEDSYQIAMRTKELLRELDRAVIMGYRSATQPSDTAYGSMGGLIDYINSASGGNQNSTAETLTPTVVNAMAKQVWDDGGEPDILVVGGTQKQKVSAFDKEYRRTTLDSRRAGFTVEEFVTDIDGKTLQIVVERWMPIDTVLVLDSSRIDIKPMQTRGFFLELLAKTGDFTPWQIVGEYTMEVKNADKAHAIHRNLKQ